MSDGLVVPVQCSRAGWLQYDVESPGEELRAHLLFPAKVDDAAGIVRLAHRAARVVRRQVGIPLEVELTGQWLIPGTSDGEMDVRRPEPSADPVGSRADREELVCSACACANAAAEPVLFRRAVILAVGVRLPEIQERARDGGRAVRADDPSPDDQPYPRLLGSYPALHVRARGHAPPCAEHLRVSAPRRFGRESSEPPDRGGGGQHEPVQDRATRHRFTMFHESLLPAG